MAWCTQKVHLINFSPRQSNAIHNPHQESTSNQSINSVCRLVKWTELPGQLLLRLPILVCFQCQPKQIWPPRCWCRPHPFSTCRKCCWIAPRTQWSYDAKMNERCRKNPKPNPFYIFQYSGHKSDPMTTSGDWCWGLGKPGLEFERIAVVPILRVLGVWRWKIETTQWIPIGRELQKFI